MATHNVDFKKMFEFCEEAEIALKEINKRLNPNIIYFEEVKKAKAEAEKQERINKKKDQLIKYANSLNW